MCSRKLIGGLIQPIGQSCCQSGKWGNLDPRGPDADLFSHPHHKPVKWTSLHFTRWPQRSQVSESHGSSRTRPSFSAQCCFPYNREHWELEEVRKGGQALHVCLGPGQVMGDHQVHKKSAGSSFNRRRWGDFQRSFHNPLPSPNDCFPPQWQLKIYS